MYLFVSKALRKERHSMFPKSRAAMDETANESLVFTYHSNMHTKTHRTNLKTDKSDGKHVLCLRSFTSIFLQYFYTVKLHSLPQSVWGPLHILMDTVMDFSSNYFVIFQKERRVKQWRLAEHTLKQRKSISPSWMPQDIRASYPT
jgi:hypothetical protein